MNKGGFDVIIGNPPYLETTQVAYTTRHFESADSRAIHAMCMERSVDILSKRGSLSMIVPLALPSTQRMKVIQKILEQKRRSVWFVNFAWRPAKLFDTVNRALTVFASTSSTGSKSFSTGYQKWTSECRDTLFDQIGFVGVPRERPSFWIPKLSCDLESRLFEKLLSTSKNVSEFVSRTGYSIYYRTTGGLYWKVFTDFPPTFIVNDQRGTSSRETSFRVQSESHVRPLIATLSSDVFWWWYTLTSNLRDLNPADIMSFPIPDTLFSDAQLRNLADRYLASIVENSRMLIRHQRQTGKTDKNWTSSSTTTSSTEWA